MNGLYGYFIFGLENIGSFNFSGSIENIMNEDLIVLISGNKFPFLEEW